jgi:hypothetical protein
LCDLTFVIWKAHNWWTSQNWIYARMQYLQAVSNFLSSKKPSIETESNVNFI